MDLERLRAGGDALRKVASDDFLRAWGCAATALADPSSALRQPIERHLAEAHGLSPRGLQVALACMARGVGGAIARRLFERPPAQTGGFDAIVLAGNVPGLFVQQLLRSLAARRAVLLKPASNETSLAARFVEQLKQQLPALEEAIVVRPWRGGDRQFEDAVFAAAERVIAYGDERTIHSLGIRLGRKLLAHGPKTSLAVALPDTEPRRWAAGLARDVALFDQRGCLSVAALYVADCANDWAAALAESLAALAIELPPGPPALAETAAVRLVRDEAALRGLDVQACADLASGTAIVERRAGFEASPGLRTVRIHEYSSFADLADTLEPWRGKLQGLAVCGELTAKEAPAALARSLAISRVAQAGELQEAPATWDDGVEYGGAEFQRE